MSDADAPYEVVFGAQIPYVESNRLASPRMDITRCLLPLALFVLLLVDPANRGQSGLEATSLALFVVNTALTFAPAAWGLPGSRSVGADLARLANLLLLAAVGSFATLQGGPLALLLVLGLDSLVRRFLYIGAVIGVCAGLTMFVFIVVPRWGAHAPYDFLWLATLTVLIALHRIIITTQAKQRREELRAGQEVSLKEAQRLERLVALTEAVLENRDVRASLHAIADAVRDVFRFKYVSIVTRDDASGILRRSVLLGVPQDTLDAHLNKPVDFKKLLPQLSPQFQVAPNCYFVPAEATRDDEAIPIYLGDLPRDAPRSVPDAWHERDVLLLVLTDDEDRMIGYMSVDGPLDGKIPAKATLRAMQIFVNLVGLALATTASRAAHIERNRILEEAGRLQNEFLSMVAHEVRSPLATIRGAANLLQTRHSDLTEVRRGELLGALGSATLRLNRIFEDLLLISQMDAGQLRLRPQNVQPRFIIEETMRQILMEHPGRAITLLAPPEIPSVRADEGRMSQIVNNLLSNAMKYSEEGSIITASVTVLEDAVRISVSNEGAGIAQQDRAKLFTRFGSLSDAQVSTGLGLYICKQLVEAMGGTIACESAPGATTTFSFTLPRGTSGGRLGP